MKFSTYDIVVTGGGLVGTTAALALAKAGWQVALCAPKTNWVDPRTTAVLWETVEFFQNLGIWHALETSAFPLKTMRIVDGTDRLLRAPQVDFNAAEIELPAFGYNLKNESLLKVLGTALEDNGVEMLNGMLQTVTDDDSGYNLAIDADGQTMHCSANFLVGADGRNSLVRNTLFPGERRWSYPQHAFVVNFEHNHPTQFVSTEFHTTNGPFTIVPHTQNTAGLVWLETPDLVSKISAMSKGDIEAMLERKMQSYLGAIKLLSEPASFPIKGLVANHFGEGNAVIIGEAAHVFPPIGAQGFNLGTRDINSLVNIMKRHTSAENRGRLYHNDRKADIETRVLGVDLLNKSLLSDFLPTQLLRTGGLFALGKIPPLRKMAMKMGISPTFSLNS